MDFNLQGVGVDENQFKEIQVLLHLNFICILMTFITFIE